MILQFIRILPDVLTVFIAILILINIETLIWVKEAEAVEEVEAVEVAVHHHHHLTQLNRQVLLREVAAMKLIQVKKRSLLGFLKERKKRRKISFRQPSRPILLLQLLIMLNHKVP